MSPAALPVRHLLIGPARHGVVRHGLGLWQACSDGPDDAAPAAASRRPEHRLLRWEQGIPAPEDLDLRPEDGGLVHLSWTDHLLGRDPRVSAERALALAGGLPLSAGVHDVPQPQEGADRLRRRTAGLAALCRGAAAVTVGSEHEAAQVRALVGADLPADRLHVVPLPFETPASGAGEPAAVPAPRPAGGAVVVGLLGFVYPGKGYEDVLRAVPEGTLVRALGAVSDGHQDHVRGLQELARERGVELEVTGFVPEAELARELAAVDVPVCPHRHVSASGSLATWIAHGRVPLAVEGPYMREIADRWPGRLHLAERERLAPRIAELAADPAATRTQAGMPPWGWPQVAQGYERIWRELA